MANFNEMTIMTILVLVDMAINMANIGVSAKTMKNVDNLWKQIGQKLMATPQFCVQNSDIFFVYIQPWVK